MPLSLILWAKIIVSNPSEAPRCSGYFAVLSSHPRWIFCHQGEASQGCLSHWGWLYPSDLDGLTLVIGPDLLMTPSHPLKCHTPPEALTARYLGNLMAEWTFIWDGNFPAQFKRHKEVTIHGFLCVTKLFRRDCSMINTPREEYIPLFPQQNGATTQQCIH